MKLVRVEDAVGQVLCHDITRIIRGVTKDAVFRKGHVIREEDIPVLLNVGKEHIYVWENDERMLRHPFCISQATAKYDFVRKKSKKSRKYLQKRE